MGYVSRLEHVLVDTRLYLPEDWAKDRKRRKKCGVPPEVRYRTWHELALEMLDERGGRLPHAWVAGDDEMGRPAWFRQALQERGKQYVLAVPSTRRSEIWRRRRLPRPADSAAGRWFRSGRSVTGARPGPRRPGRSS